MEPDRQLESVIGDVLKSGDFQALDAFLQRDISEGTIILCSQLFLAKLDKCITRSLVQKDSKSACLGFAIIYKCGKHLKVPGDGQGLSGLIAQGLVRKMEQWFEKCRQLWIHCGPKWDESLFNLSEDFFDALMVIHEACREGTYKITESFLYPVGQLGVDSRVYILIQKEALRKFNLILDKLPAEIKKDRKILTSQAASDIMIKLAGKIMEGGDYDMQTALVEALCRMATPDQRKELAHEWFNLEHVSTAFARVRDSDFETDCRKFLNLVNGMQGDKRRVYSYPCLEVYLDNHELLMPADEKLDEFWIDFNLGSHSISFYFSSTDEEAQEDQWETICITEKEVQSYTVTEEGRRKVLLLKLSEVVVVGAVNGSSLSIHFSSSLDILQAACSVYGQRKNKGFVGKKSTSVVKTTVTVIMEENSSQQVVPESQVSLGETEKNTAANLLPASPTEKLTPAKIKISDSSTFIRTSAGGSLPAGSCLSSVMSSGPARGRVKPSLEMVHAFDRKGEFYMAEQMAVAKICSHNTTPRSTKAGAMVEKDETHEKSQKNMIDKHKKNILVPKATEMVLAGESENLSMGDGFVADTQPRTKINIPSNFNNKRSVSEIITMPTQKLSSNKPRPGMEPQKEGPSMGQTWSVPASGPVTQKQFHTRVTQRLQQVLSERSQNCAPQEPATPHRKKSIAREDFKARRSSDKDASTLYTPEKKQPQRNAATKEKSKHQTSLEQSVAPNKSSVKASTTKAKQKKILSSREKRDAEAAGSMMKVISSHYRYNTQSTRNDFPKICVSSLLNRSSLDFGMFSVAKTDVSGALRKSLNVTKSTRQGEDIFAFNIDTPLSIGEKPIINTSVISSSHNNDSSVLHSTGRKGQPVVKQKNRDAKKHLFSETDTDSAMTEVSWLKESCTKPKPKVNIYSRQAPVKPKATTPRISYDSPDLPSTNPKPVGNSTKPKKKMPAIMQKVEQPKETVKSAGVSSQIHVAARRPKRAAATSTKNYKEPNTDSSQSESEKPTVTKNRVEGQKRKSQKTCFGVSDINSGKNATSGKSTDTNRRVDHNHSDVTGFKQKPKDVVKTTLKSKKKTVIPSGQKLIALMDSCIPNHSSLCLSSLCIDKMRSAERSAPTLELTCSPLITPQGSPLPTSPDPASQDTPLPNPLLPRPPSAVSSKGISKLSSHYCPQNTIRTSKTQSIHFIPSFHLLTTDSPTGPSAAEPFQQCLSPAAPLSLSTLPLLTSTRLELDKPSIPSPLQLPFPKNTVSHCDLSKSSPVSPVSLSQSSTKSSGLMKSVTDSPTTALAVCHEIEKSLSSDNDLNTSEFLESGPSRKRHISLSSNSEKDETEEKKKSKMRGQLPRMKPRKLFKSFKEMSADGELDQIISSAQTVNSSHREDDDVGIGDLEIEEHFDLSKMTVNPSNICQKFSSELKKKFQNRYKMIEIYNKQSLKTVQQHVSLLSMQVTKYRAQRLEQVKNFLLEEIHKLEQDDTVLKNMEKDLAIYCKKQTMAFHLYQEKDTKRNETFKKALKSNVFPSWEYEQKIFTSQLCLIRKDMKSVQDRLLGEMHQGEIQSVRRGLHALYFPDGARF